MIKLRKLKRDTLEYEFLPPVLEIEETPPSPLGPTLIWIILIFLTTAIAWSIIGKVDEVAIARGKMIPDGRVKVIQPFEEGIVTAIHVEEGQRVKEGQLLLELDSTFTETDVTHYESMLAIATFEKAVLLSEYEHTPFPEMDLSEAGLDSAGIAQITQLQANLKQAREEEFERKKAALQLLISQRESEYEIENLTLERLEKNNAFKEWELTVNDEKTAESFSDVLTRKNDIYSMEQEVIAQTEKVEKAMKSLEEAQENLIALEKERERDLLDRIMEKEKQMTELESQLVKSQKRFDLQHIYSPVDGTIHGLNSYTIGGVVTPAQPIISIVPEDTPIIVEANVSNKDIGFIHVGQAVEIKIDTFPFTKYGTIVGEVTYISPDTFDDEQLGPIFKAKILLEKDHLLVNSHKVQLNPGMTVTAEIKTGKRRVIEFFLAPIIKGFKESVNLR